MTRKVTKVSGPPGTGKTTFAIGLVEKHMREGIPPERIAFTSYTKKAALEAMTRATQKFDLKPSKFPYFKTLHSIAFMELGLRRDNVMDHKDDIILGELLGIEFSRYGGGEAGPALGGTEGDRMRSISNFAQATTTSLAEAWRTNGEGVDWFKLKLFHDTEQAYKNDTGKIDFSDMLAMFNTTIPIDVAIIDEAQDLTAAQWAMARKAFKNTKHIYIIGDDDQCIYEWSGADINTLLTIKADEHIVLNQSYRLPKTAYDLSLSIIKRIKRREKKEFSPKDEQGNISFINDIEQMDLAGDNWMLLARNGYFLSAYEEHCRLNGWVYQRASGSSVNKTHLHAIRVWEKLRKGETVEGGLLSNKFLPFETKRDFIPEHEYSTSELGLGEELPIWHEALTSINFNTREYYLNCLNSGENLIADPRIYIGTIHSVKGGECENVVLNTDMTRKTAAGYDLSPDAEHRVFYVGVTRTKNNLHIIQPQTTQFYQT